MSTAAPRARLVVTGGPLDGREVLLDDGAEKRFGTAEQCDLQVQAGHIEPLHATLRYEAGKLVLDDAGSVAGTYVNGEKVGTGRELYDGDRVCLGPPGFRGSVKMIVDLTAAAAGVEAEPVLLDPADFAAPPARPPAAVEDAPLQLEPEAGEDVFDLSAEADAGDDFRLDAPPPPGAEPAAAAPTMSDAAPTTPDEEDWTRGAPPEPVSPPPPAAPPPAVPSPVAAVPSPAPPPRAVARPDYSDGISIGDDVARPKEPLLPPPTPVRREAAAPSRRGAGLHRILVINGIVAALAIGGLVVWRMLRQPVPVAASLSVSQARPGEPVTVTGTHMGGEPGEWTVHFGDTAAPASAVTDSEVTAIVPGQLAAPGAAQVAVAVEGPGGRSNDLPLTILRGPQVTALVPDVARPGERVVVTGRNLAGEQVAVTIGGLPATVGTRAAERLEVTVPALGVEEGMAVPVVVRVGSDAAAPVQMIVGGLPMVTAVQPPTGTAASRVELQGRGFDPSPGATRVAFDGRPALVLAASADRLEVMVPAIAGSGPVDLPIVVEAGGSTSRPLPFRYDAPSSSIYIPRYVAMPSAEHPGHDHVVVGDAIGPLLTLTGAAEGRSAAVRAAALADALNALAADAPRVRPELSARTDPPAILAAGRSDPLVTVTEADAAAYAETWEGVTTTPTTPPALAGYWAALLADHLTLFAMHERPLRLVQLTPRGKLFLDLWSDAARRGNPEAGIPTRLLYPVPASVASGLRTLSASAPAEKRSGASASLAVAGKWTGRMVQNGISRSIVVTLAVEGKGLSGTLTTHSGAVAMAVPLSKVAFDGGELRFTVRLAGKDHAFRGRLEGRRITGTLTGGGEPGELSLELAE